MKQLLLLIGILFSGMIQAQITVNENPDPLVVCDDNNNGFAFFDLHDADADILGDLSLIVTYHMTLLDAEAAINVLMSPYMNQVPYLDTVFARVENSQQNLYVVVLLDLRVQELPQITTPIDLVTEDANGDGFAIFDLTENNAVMLDGLDPSDFNVFYYETEGDALNGEFHIADPTSYQNIENPQTIYVRVQTVDRGCFVIASFIISVETLSMDSFTFKDLSISPNPTSGFFTVHSMQLVSETKILIYDIQGKVLFAEKMFPQNGNLKMDVSSLENGVYFVKIASERNTVLKKLIKK